MSVLIKLRSAIPVQFRSWKNLLQYGRNILVSIDQLVGVILFAGDPDETISSIVGKEANEIRSVYLKFGDSRQSEEHPHVMETDMVWNLPSWRKWVRYRIMLVLSFERLIDFMLGENHCVEKIEDDETKEGGYS